MKVKVDLKSLGYKTPVEVKPSIVRVRRTLDFQNQIVSLGKPEEEFQKLNSMEQVIHINNMEIKTIELTSEYLTDVLGLSDKQKEKLDELEYPELQDISNDVVRKILGRDKEDAENTKSGKK